MTRIAHLTDRGVLRVAGVDAISFLNGLISQDVTKVTAEQPLYGCLLTPQGKYFADFMILLDGDAVLLDMPLVRVEPVLQRLKMFVLRSKVTISNVTNNYNVYASWPKGESFLGYTDPRLAVLGKRISTELDIVANASLDDYHVWRIQNGVPDVADFELERTALLEANLDRLHGIAWDKGCYMGQELTARTHYRGLVKKRLLPFRFDGDAPSYDTELHLGDQVIGHTRSTAGSYGMALVKLDSQEALFDSESHITVANTIITIEKPEWFVIQQN